MSPPATRQFFVHRGHVVEAGLRHRDLLVPYAVKLRRHPGADLAPLPRPPVRLARRRTATRGRTPPPDPAVTTTNNLDDEASRSLAELFLTTARATSSPARWPGGPRGHAAAHRPTVPKGHPRCRPVHSHSRRPAPVVDLRPRAALTTSRLISAGKRSAPVLSLMDGGCSRSYAAAPGGRQAGSGGPFVDRTGYLTGRGTLSLKWAPSFPRRLPGGL